jgi:hypothetical protein
MAMLEDLEIREASGVLEVMGNPSGVIYLDGGRIVYARASWVPGLAARLRAIAPSLSGTAEPEPDQDADDAESARLAVRHGYLTTAGLHELIGSVVAEAFAVLTVPLAPDSYVAGIRFTPIPTHWADLFPRLNVDAVHQEAVRQAERMADCELAPTTAVAPCDLATPCAVLTREQWAVACQIGDRMTAGELAMRSGASLSDTIHCLGSLVRAGLCVPVWAGGRGHAAAARNRVQSSAHRVPPAAHDAAPPPVPDLGMPELGVPAVGVPALGVPAVGVPALGVPALGVPAPAARASAVRAPDLTAERLPPRTRTPAWPGRHASQNQAPSTELLRRVLNGLRRLA